MTGYGERVTQKEISAVHGKIMPGALPLKCGNGGYPDASDWQKAQAGQMELRFQDFHFEYYDHMQPPARKIKLHATSDCLLLQFCLNGTCRFAAANGTLLGCLKPAEYNLLHLSANQPFILSFATGRSETVSVYLEKPFLLKYIPQDHALFQKIQTATTQMLHSENLAISPGFVRALHDLTHCAFEGHLKKLYTQAKIIELLALQIGQLEETKNQAMYLKQSEIEKMLAVKEIIESSFREPLSLCHLARQVVTNEQYLKKHFKMVCGCTVYNYILRCRMEKAKELLQTGEYKIAEITELTGYKYATHFTSAFKKYFGYLPQEIKGKAE